MVELTIIGPDRRLERTGRKRPEKASPLAADPIKLDVGSSRGKAHEFSLWSRQSASASREAAVFDSASGSSVTGADAAAWLPVVRVLWSPRRARLRRGSVGRALAGWRYCLSGQQWLRSWPFAQPGAPGDRPHKAAVGRLSFHVGRHHHLAPGSQYNDLSPRRYSAWEINWKCCKPKPCN